MHGPADRFFHRHLSHIAPSSYQHRHCMSSLNDANRNSSPRLPSTRGTKSKSHRIASPAHRTTSPSTMSSHRNRIVVIDIASHRKDVADSTGSPTHTPTPPPLCQTMVGRDKPWSTTLNHSSHRNRTVIASCPKSHRYHIGMVLSHRCRIAIDIGSTSLP